MMYKLRNSLIWWKTKKFNGHETFEYFKGMCLHGSCLIFCICISHLQPLALEPHGRGSLLPPHIRYSSLRSTGDAPARVATDGSPGPRNQRRPHDPATSPLPTPTAAIVALPHPDDAATTTFGGGSMEDEARSTRSTPNGSPSSTRRQLLSHQRQAMAAPLPSSAAATLPRVPLDPVAPTPPRPLDLAAMPLPSPTGGSGGGAFPSRRQRRLSLNLP